jgi:hypothetical protein
MLLVLVYVVATDEVKPIKSNIAKHMQRCGLGYILSREKLVTKRS